MIASGKGLEIFVYLNTREINLLEKHDLSGNASLYDYKDVLRVIPFEISLNCNIRSEEIEVFPKIYLPEASKIFIYLGTGLYNLMKGQAISGNRFDGGAGKVTFLNTDRKEDMNLRGYF